MEMRRFTPYVCLFSTKIVIFDKNPKGVPITFFEILEQFFQLKMFVKGVNFRAEGAFEKNSSVQIPTCKGNWVQGGGWLKKNKEKIQEKHQEKQHFCAFSNVSFFDLRRKGDRDTPPPWIRRLFLWLS